MIKPNKYTNLETSVVNVAAIIIRELISTNTMKYGRLKKNVINTVTDEVSIEFDLALSFLYLLEKITYDVTNDTLELII